MSLTTTLIFLLHHSIAIDFIPDLLAHSKLYIYMYGGHLNNFLLVGCHVETQYGYG